MLIAQRRDEAIIVTAGVLFVTRSALLLEDRFTQFEAATVSRFRKARWVQLIQISRDVGPGLGLRQSGSGDNAVHLGAVPFQFGEIGELLDEVSPALSGERRNSIGSATQGCRSVTLRAVLGIELFTSFGVLIELQRVADLLVYSQWRSAGTHPWRCEQRKGNPSEDMRYFEHGRYDAELGATWSEVFSASTR